MLCDLDCIVTRQLRCALLVTRISSSLHGLTFQQRHSEVKLAEYYHSLRTNGASFMTSAFSRPDISRSVTPSPTKTQHPPIPRLVKSSSSPHINKSMAAVAAPQHPMSAMRDGHAMMDTRTPSPVGRNGSMDSPLAAAPESEAYKPDLSAEVAMLSTKLVNAINYQTNLDDSLQQTRHELESTQKELARVRREKKEVDDLVASGTLIRKSYADKTINALRAELETERAARMEAEKSKKQTEGELENLTTALFEEANTMVAAARRDTEAVERRERQVRTQLEDTELLLASQTEQLQDLKGVMERLEERQSEYDVGRGDLSMPVTPVDARTAAWDAALQFSPTGGAAAELTPDHPLHFSHLLAPIMRTDIASYLDFRELLALSRRASPHSRQSSSSTNLASSSQTNLASTSAAATSSPSLPGSFFSNSTNNSPSSGTFNTQSSFPPLKDSKFYKRALAEDIEPTLRLDLAPGLSFLSRRSVLSSLLGGSLVVEPFNAQIKQYGLGAVFGCALCGETRKVEPFVRRHRFRTSEDDGAQRYPLCDHCLGRIRATGDFVGFLRMLRDGHWRCDGEGDEKSAWDEATRLRERMFWARLGGGVVPASQLVRRDISAGSPESARGVKSARHSLESIPEASARENLEHAASSVTVTETELAVAEDDHLKAAPVQTQRDRSTSSIARAIMGTSSGVLATSRPDVQPEMQQQQPAESDHETLEAPETDDEPTTPMFEDAQTDSQEQQAAADEQLQREATSAIQSDIPTVQEPTPDLAPPAEKPIMADRRPSGVLARVRAMEAKAQEKKVPGGFE
ncbi:rab guanine nucleotide exchange factor S2 [Elasticomyces elasticus]|nr:rab guanine nucleotide exchange factor S2 [Elasticomyces elasticus]KAK5717244.1 rab guanine nucleotide exchange factor S2 [Elasticomyces elasticus]